MFEKRKVSPVQELTADHIKALELARLFKERQFYEADKSLRGLKERNRLWDEMAKVAAEISG